MTSGVKNVLLLLSFFLVAAGFVFSFWLLSVFGILLAAGSGQWIAALALGLFLDVAYGAPVGLWRIWYAPFTLLAVVVSVAQISLAFYVRPNERHTL